MNLRPVLYLALAAITGVGCSARLSAPSGFLHFVGRNLTHEPIRWADDGHFKKIAHRRAEEAWKDLGDAVPKCSCPHDYKCGFIEGFVDYLDAGGNGEPPAVPPFRYRLTHHMTEPGIQATEAWFAGFRHGAAVAKASGMRAAILTPISAPPYVPPTPPLMPEVPHLVQPPRPKTLPEPEKLPELPSPREKDEKKLPEPKPLPPDDDVTKVGRWQRR